MPTPSSHRRRRTAHFAASAITSAAAILSDIHSESRQVAAFTVETAQHAASVQRHSLPGSFPSTSTTIRHAETNHRYMHATSRSPTALYGWLDNFLPKPYDAETAEEADAKRRSEYPEQYPATYEVLPPSSFLPEDHGDTTLTTVRPLLKQTQLERRPLKVAYDAAVDGWEAPAFHAKVDGCGAAVVLATTTDGHMVGGYNPKGWAGLGGARPSVAAFLFYQKRQSSSMDGDGGSDNEWQKLVKVGGGGLACSTDNPDEGIYFGADGLVIPLRAGERSRAAQSKLGPYFERGPDDLSSIFSAGGGGAATLQDLKVIVGIYPDGEEIPYSGGVMDMTSG